MTSSINEAGWDRGLRILLGLFILFLGWAGVVGGTLGLVFKVIGFLPLATGIVGWCPAYAVLGFSTYKVTTKPGPAGHALSR